MMMKHSKSRQLATSDNETNSGNCCQQLYSCQGCPRSKIMDIDLGKIKLADRTVFTADDVKKGSNVVLISKKFLQKKMASMSGMR